MSDETLGSGRAWPAAGDVARWTDTYFSRTKAVVGKFGDVRVTYAVFMRRPVVCAPRLAVDWLRAVAAERGFELTIEQRYREGQWVGASRCSMSRGRCTTSSISRRCC